ncbi:MAG: penicillin acylase family protein [Acidimicrobiales bacterium]
MTVVGTDHHEAEIRRTTHGVAHVRGATLPDVIFGQGYACAADHLPTIADQILKTRSERARFFGRGAGDCHLNSDLGYLALDVGGWARRMASTQSPEMVAIVEAYAAGINRWLDDHGTSGLPEWCRDAPWVRRVSALDLFGLYADAALMASGRNLAQFLGSARAPGDTDDTVSPDGPLLPDDLPGSNGWALGSAATATGRGMVVANPHFPWYGDGRFWECHLTVPGELDVYGASLVGAPAVHIGFNRDVAWTHTFSAGHRFVLYRLELTPGDPTSYRFGDETRSMTSREVTVDVLGDDGSLTPLSRTLWRSHHGPMVDIPLLGWSEGMGFAMRDVNDGNDRFLSQYLAMDRATSVDELRAAVHEHQGLPWVNVISADRHGKVWYSDPSPTPHLDADVASAYDDAVESDPLTALFFSQRVALLDGSDPSTEWIEDPAALQPGAVPPSGLPELFTDTVAFNSNDPYWVPHPELRIGRGPVLAGLYGRALSPRTRMNAAVLAGMAPSGPTGPDGRWTLDDLERALLDNRSLLAEMVLDDVIERCRAAGVVESGGASYDLAAVADLLAGWDRAFDVDSRGAIVWREFLGGFSKDELRHAGALWAEPFDVDRPTVTPHGLAPAPASGADPVVTKMVAGLKALEAAGLAIDTPLGEAQYVDRSGRRIPLHGANEVEGIINVVAPLGAFQRSDLEPAVPTGEPVAGRAESTGLRVGGYPVTYGASIVMVVGFDDDGPVGRGLLTYGQSGDDRSPHHVDQMEEFSAKRLRPLRFHDEDIAADPDLTTITVSD